VAFTGARPFRFLEGSGFFFLYDQGFDSTVRTRGTSFHHVQLLSANGVAEFGPWEKYFRSNSRRGARPLWIFSGRICGYARTRSFADWRTGPGNAFDGDAGFEAACFAAAAAEEKTSRGTIGAGLRGRRGVAGAFLATAIF